MNSRKVEKQVSYAIVLIFVVFVIIFKLFGWEMRDIVSLFTNIMIAILIIAIVVSFLNAMIASKKMDAGIKRLKDKCYFTELRLDYVFGTPKGALLVAGLDRGNRHYKFLSYYIGNAYDIEKIIKNNNVESVKVWVDLLFLKLYEIDLDDLFIKMGRSYSLDCRANILIKDLKEANETINDYKKRLL